MNKLLPIALGGALGAVLRYALSDLAYRLLGEGFPWGTVFVNLLGCLVIGFIWGLTERSPLPPSVAAFTFTGVIGAFTTFSAYGLETANLLRAGELRLGLANVLASNVLGIVFVFVGLFAARLLIGLVSPQKP